MTKALLNRSRLTRLARSAARRARRVVHAGATALSNATAERPRTPAKDNAAMGIMCGSHRSPIEMDRAFVRQVENAGGQLVIDADDEPNQRFTEEEKKIPLAWRALPGDVLIFDERLYHNGRRVENGKVNTNRAAPKFCLSLVFGADNRHSERMYSYFRYARRELVYRDLHGDFRRELADRGLVLSNGWGNYYEQFPQDLRHAFLKEPNTLEPLIEEFSMAGASR